MVQYIYINKFLFKNNKFIPSRRGAYYIVYLLSEMMTMNSTHMPDKYIVYHCCLPVEWDEDNKPHTAHVTDRSKDPYIADVWPGVPGIGTCLCVVTYLNYTIIYTMVSHCLIIDTAYA